MSRFSRVPLLLLALALTAGTVAAQTSGDPAVGVRPGEPWRGPGDPSMGELRVHQLLSRSRDLDGDRLPERVEIQSRTGASGTLRAWLVVWPGWGPPAPFTSLIGDGIQVVDLQVTRAGVFIELLQTGIDDRPGFPTEWVSTRWAWDGGAPRLVDAVVRGPLTPELLQGTTWRWIGDVTPGTTRISGATLEFRGTTTVGGRTECGRWVGQLRASGFPGDLAIAARPQQAVRCSPTAREQEEVFLYRISAVDRITFEMGRLSLYDSRDPRRRVLFEPSGTGLGLRPRREPVRR